MTTEATPMLNLIDIIAIIIILAGTWHGITRGASPSFATFMGAILGLVTGLALYPVLLKAFNPSGTMNVSLQHFLAMMASVVAAFTVLAIIRYIINQLSRFSSITFLDRLGGGIASLIQTSTIVFLLFIALISVDDKDFVRIFGKESAIGRQTMVVTRYLGMTIGSDYEKTQKEIDAQYNLSPLKNKKPR